MDSFDQLPVNISQNMSMMQAQTKLPQVLQSKNHFVSLKAQYSQLGLITSVAIFIYHSCINGFNITRNINEHQAVQIAGEIVIDHEFETMDDIFMMMKMATSGRLSKHYQSIDKSMVLGWWREYLDYKYEQKVEMQREENKIQIGSPGEFPVAVVKIMKKIAKEKGQQDPEKYMTEKQKQEKTRVVYMEYLREKGKKTDVAKK